MKDYLSHIASNIQKRRCEQQRSQEWLAEKANISCALLQDIEAAQHDPTLGQLIVIAAALSMSVADLLDLSSMA